MPLVIALTGGIGSGKSSVAAVLKELGAAVIDTDEIAHRLTAAGEPGARAIGKQFGPEYLREDGALDRSRMRKLVFSDPQSKKKLEAILHPMIRTEVTTAVNSVTGPYIVIVVPLLIETGAYRDLAHRTLVVDCSEQTQVTRVMQRNELGADAVQSIIASQVSRAERLKHADDIIQNESTIAELRADVVALHRVYLELATQGSNSAQSRQSPLKT